MPGKPQIESGYLQKGHHDKKLPSCPAPGQLAEQGEGTPYGGYHICSANPEGKVTLFPNASVSEPQSLFRPAWSQDVCIFHSPPKTPQGGPGPLLLFV